MHIYFSTCIPGTVPIIQKELSKRYPGTQYLNSDESSLVYRSEAEPQDIKQLRLFNNSFILVKTINNLGRNPLKTLVNQCIQDKSLIRNLTSYTKNKPRAVRVMFYEDNEGIQIPTPIRENIENYIQKEKTLKINRRIADVEVWVLSRSNNTGIIGIRLTYFPSGEKNLEHGQLKPQLAHLMCLLSEPTPQERVLDPFAGFGSIPFERTYFKSKEIIASDVEKSVTEALEKKVKAQNKNITIYTQDAANMEYIEAHSIDKIITDPPWGIYEKHIDIPTLYEKLLTECQRITHEKSILVILTAQKEVLEKTAQNTQWLINEKFDILVSGKKAALYKLSKKLA